MANRNILDILEQFFLKRKSPEDLVNDGILKTNPTLPEPGTGLGKFFNKNLSEVPKIDGIPSIVVECANYLENSG